MDNVKVDFAIIGSGGAAFAAAIRATGLGKSVAMIERGTLGGTCVNVGCIPSKAMLAAAEARHVALDARRFPGITATAGDVDLRMLRDGTQALVDRLRTAKYADVAEGYGWQQLQGDAVFAGTPEKPRLLVTHADGSVTELSATNYLIATGSRPVIAPIPGIDEVEVLTSTTAMQLDEVPESLLVIGGGYVALEQAQLFARLGANVTMLARSRLASHEEPEANDTLVEVLADEGIQVVLDARVESLSTNAAAEVEAIVDVAGVRQSFRAGKLLMAVGREPATADLNLDAVGVKTGQRGEVLVDSRLVSSNPHIWAAGDVNGHHEFVYVAAAHGAIVVENAFTDTQRSVDYTALPRVTFTSPALAAVGMTEQQASEAGILTESRVLPLEYVPRAIVNRDTRGFIKVVAARHTGQILGITAVAKDAGELGAAGVHILNAGLTVEDVTNTWAPYLTMSEGIKLACQTFTTKVEQLSCCAS